jgi:hypothetical protein
MIISASRRSDLPAFYGAWFIQRLKEGSVCIVNPRNPRQISAINLNPDNIKGIVFWTKNPKNFIDSLDIVNALGYADRYYFQFTITPYGADIEKFLGDKRQIIETFKLLADKIGSKRVILRYDPIFFTSKYNLNFHLKAFERLISLLKGRTQRIVISFLDIYKKVIRNMSGIDYRETSLKEMELLGKTFADIAGRYKMSVETCSEAMDLGKFGIKPTRCIDGNLIEEISGLNIDDKAKSGVRKHCLCMKSVDIGRYDTCIFGCLYCYANANKAVAERKYRRSDISSLLPLGIH